MPAAPNGFTDPSGGRPMPTEPDHVPSEQAPSTRRRRRRWLLAGAVAVPALALALWWFEPQALLFDDVVDEGFPIADAAEADDSAAGGRAADAPSAGEEEPADAERDPAQPDDGAGADSGDDAADGATPPPSGPVELAAGSFESRNRYTVTGTATTFQLEDGRRVLRLEDFESTNGPDLFVYLTVAGTADDDAALDGDFVDLGELTGNIGNQNYVIPDDVDLERYTSVAIWCRRFTTSFGVADLATS
jgi:hypothetical protein